MGTFDWSLEDQASDFGLIEDMSRVYTSPLRKGDLVESKYYQVKLGMVMTDVPEFSKSYHRFRVYDMKERKEMSVLIQRFNKIE